MSVLKALVQASGHMLLLPMYHLLSDGPCPYVDPLYPVRDSVCFRRDLEFFLKHFEPVGLDQILERYGPDRHKPFPKPSVHLTIDDGLRPAATLMAPLLLEYGMPATFLVNSGFLHNQSLMYRYETALQISRLRELRRSGKEQEVWMKIAEVGTAHGVHLSVTDSSSPEKRLLGLRFSDSALIRNISDIMELDVEEFLKKERPYLGPDELDQLQRQGFSIGGHSLHHPWLQDLAPNEQRREILEDREKLLQEIPRLDPVFAFPFSDAGLPEALFRDVYQSGYQLSLGGAGLKKDLSGNLPRVPMERDRREATVIVKEAYWKSLASRLAGRGKMQRPA